MKHKYNRASQLGLLDKTIKTTKCEGKPVATHMKRSDVKRHCLGNGTVGVGNGLLLRLEIGVRNGPVLRRK